MSKIEKTTAYTKGAKKRARKARKAMEDACPLAPIPKRQPQPRIKGRFARRGEDPRSVVLSQRENAIGICAMSGRHIVLDPILGTDMGRCIWSITTGKEQKELSEAWAAMSASRRNYRQRIIGKTGEPQNAALPLIHEKLETDPSLTVDLRTAEERDDAAKSSWREWARKIADLPAPQMQWAIRGALDGFMGEGRLWADGQPTATGRVAVAALRIMCEKS